ncbi:hypothetical protein L5515_007281 [Caenorhabditis briggsae]|uniref:BHLH domain-containing protein n=2 Tax=Caenorhabditis briggsae TaxID=6238 RepID=A0AAE9F4A6_CAEBR|nr:hypothetical protein L3Y34_007433 [Caenorhabditis briggsae]UMM34032.1 hypothetical protein L5515_007281 [Caenorhabditis briggsae]
MSNFLSMFPVTYSFENGVYSTIINQTPNAHGLNGLDQDVGKLMVPILETPQAHIPQLMELQQPQQTQIQHEIPLQPPCSLSSSIFSQPQISQTSTTSSAASSSSQKKYVNPFAPEATVPLPIELEDQFGPYSSSVWKRNERERCRVRNVNDGYEKLRRHLPVHFDEKRISKVDTLRLAIRYIRHLDNLLKNPMHQYDCKCFNGFQEESEGNISIDISTFQFNSIALC